MVASFRRIPVARTRFPLTVLVLVIGSTLIGCGPSSWKGSWKSSDWESAQTYAPPESTGGLRGNRMEPGSVALEIALAQLDAEQTAELESLMAKTDHQALDLELRKRLDRNGIWAGVLPSKPLAEMSHLLADQPIDVSQLQPWQVDFLEQQGRTTRSPLVLHERIQNGRGEEHPIPVSNTWAERSWVIHEGTGPSVGQGQNVRGYIVLRTYPTGDEGVRLIAVPQIRHGRTQAEYRVAEGSFAYGESQAKVVVDALKIDVRLRPGEILALSASATDGRLGSLLFGAADRSADLPHASPPDPDEPVGRRLLLVRLVQTQRNDLFEADHTISGTSGF